MAATKAEKMVETRADQMAASMVETSAAETAASMVSSKVESKVVLSVGSSAAPKVVQMGSKTVASMAGYLVVLKDKLTVVSKVD
jgi:hypothetical protein